MHHPFLVSIWRTNTFIYIKNVIYYAYNLQKNFVAREVSMNVCVQQHYAAGVFALAVL